MWNLTNVVYTYFHMFHVTNYHPFISAWRVPFSISRKVGMVAKKLHFWRAVLLGQLFSIGSFFLLVLRIHDCILSWSVRSVLRNLLLVSWSFLYVFVFWILQFAQCILQLHNFCLVHFYVFYLSVELLFLFFCCFPNFVELHIRVLYSSLSIFRTIILNCLLGKSCISITLGFVTDGLLCSFGGLMIPWFFMIPCRLS